MIQYSKYFKDIGLTRSDVWMLPDDSMEDRRYHLNNKTKFAEVETWNMNYTMALVIYGYLREYEPYVPFAVPLGMEKEEWQEVYNKIRNGFEVYLTISKEHWLEAEEQKVWDEARNLLVKYWDAFWW